MIRDFSRHGKPRRRPTQKRDGRSGDGNRMTSVDLAVLGVMLVSGLLAFSRGLIREVLSIGAWLGAAAIAMAGLPMVRPLLEPHVPSPEWTDPASYIVV